MFTRSITYLSLMAILSALCCTLFAAEPNSAPASKETQADQQQDKNASPFEDPQAAAAFEAFNAYRVKCGLKPCKFSQTLQNYAQSHSNNMYSRGRLYHSKGYGSAENVYMGSTSGVDAVYVWSCSPGHQANMLGPYTQVGIARTGGFFTMILQ